MHLYLSSALNSNYADNYACVCALACARACMRDCTLGTSTNELDSSIIFIDVVLKRQEGAEETRSTIDLESSYGQQI